MSDESKQDSIAIRVYGHPKPGGSKTAYRNRFTGKIAVVDACKKSEDWKSLVAYVASQAMLGKERLCGPLCATMRFYLPRPTNHYLGGDRSRPLRKGAPEYPAVKPDLTKLVRSTEDALTGILWHDDAQIVGHEQHKDYATDDNPVGAIIEVSHV